jgi:hypothetical protein
MLAASSWWLGHGPIVFAVREREANSRQFIVEGLPG